MFIIDCIEYKKSFIAEDEFDKNKRMLLNFGHTFGHALETELEYKDILHGEAILYGMIAAAYLSFKLGKKLVCKLVVDVFGNPKLIIIILI